MPKTKKTAIPILRRNGRDKAMLIQNNYRDAARRIAKGDGSPVASPPKAEVESGATMTAKPFARLRRGEIPLLHIRT